MATISDLTSGARTMLRDFPQYFEIDEGPLNVLTVRLPHPLVASTTLQVYITPMPDETTPNPPSTLTTDWQLDERNGLVKLTKETALGQRVLVSGYYFTWFTDSDLSFHMGHSVNEMLYGGLSLANMSDAQADVTMLGGVIHALWSLAMELALDIDVSTPEGMFIPARQRYTQVLQLLQNYEKEYQDKAAMLNVGLGSLEQFRLRRVALMTGRYVPVYRDREFDDPRPPDRIYPPIPWGEPAPSPSEVAGELVEMTTWASVEANE